MVLASARYCFKCSSVKSESYSRTMGAFLINVLQILITVYTSLHFTYPLAALILAFKIYPQIGIRSRPRHNIVRTNLAPHDKPPHKAVFVHRPVTSSDSTQYVLLIFPKILCHHFRLRQQSKPIVTSHRHSQNRKQE